MPELEITPAITPHTFSLPSLSDQKRIAQTQTVYVPNINEIDNLTCYVCRKSIRISRTLRLYLQTASMPLDCKHIHLHFETCCLFNEVIRFAVAVGCLADTPVLGGLQLGIVWLRSRRKHQF